MKKGLFIIILSIILSACVVPAFSCWIGLSAGMLVGASDLVVEATVKLPEDIAKTMDGGTILKLRAKEDVIVPVTFVINEVITNKDILDEDQKEIIVDVLIMGTGTSKSSIDFDYILSEGENTIFFFTKTDTGLRLMNYPTYKLSKDANGVYKDGFGDVLSETDLIFMNKK